MSESLFPTLTFRTQFLPALTVTFLSLEEKLAQGNQVSPRRDRKQAREEDDADVPHGPSVTCVPHVSQEKAQADCSPPQARLGETPNYCTSRTPGDRL